MAAFHHVSRVQAEELLMKKGTEGSFLTRRSESNPQDYTLSVRLKDGVTHVRIQHNGEFYDLYGGEEFATLPELLQYYTENPGQLKEKNGKVIVITKPLPKEEMASERWYHGNIQGREAEVLLLSKGQDGSYLIRMSSHSPGKYVLSTRVSDDVSHIMINHQDSKFFMEKGPKFSSLSELIDYYKENSIVEVSGRVVELRQAFCTTSFLPLHIAQRVEDLRKPIDELFGKSGFEEEYQQIQHEGTQHLYTRKEAGKPQNRPKNRFKNILPFDHTRVILDPDETGNQYINANYVTGEIPGSNRYYIATQGCLPATINDFWSMVWQEESKIIVMITNEIERGRNKCARYWPSMGETLVYGKFSVMSLDEKVMGSSYVLRSFLVDHTGGLGPSRCVHQFQFRSWPDHGVPQDPGLMLDFMDDINRKAKELTRNGENIGPLVVHCSAGVGRTGTYIVVDIITKLMEHQGLGNEIDIQRSIQLLRNHRSGMVQTEDQYRFVYYALKAYIEKKQAEGEAMYVNVPAHK